jgi:hypothetical protein
LDLIQYLSYHGLGIEQLAAKARQQLGLSDTDILCVCGSLVEDLGNEDSDVDLLWITQREDARPDATFAIGSCICDVATVNPNDLQRLLTAASAWPTEPEDARAAAADYRQRRLLHRLRGAIGLHGAARLTALQCRLEPRAVARQNLACARYYVSTLQIDLAGMRKAGDWVTMRFVALELLNSAVDALLAAYGSTNPTPKWRTRLLAKLPRNWAEPLPGRPFKGSALDTYLSFYEQPEQMSPAASYAFALRVVTFSRRVLAWAEQRLADDEQPRTPQLLSMPVMTSPPMPELDLDVAIKFRGGRFELTRLKSRAQIYALSARAYWLLCLFDGETSEPQFRQCAVQLALDHGIEEVDDLLALVRHARLEAPPVIDEGRLQALLRAVR